VRIGEAVERLDRATRLEGARFWEFYSREMLRNDTGNCSRTSCSNDRRLDEASFEIQIMSYAPFP